MRVCHVCGTLYSPKQGPCPKCSAEELLKSGKAAEEAYAQMTPEESDKARRKAWIQILIGVPAFIGLIYLIIYVMKLVGR